MRPRLENDKLLIVFFLWRTDKNFTPENCVKTVIAACQLAAHFETAQKGNFFVSDVHQKIHDSLSGFF